jgi:oxygen-independent coproporphyrinogen-3 oxidase
MNGSGEEESLCLSSEEQATEALMMGLRLTSGIQLSSFPFLENTVINSAALNILVDSGYLILTETTLKATPLGLQCLNAVLRRLLSPS